MHYAPTVCQLAFIIPIVLFRGGIHSMCRENSSPGCPHPIPPLREFMVPPCSGPDDKQNQGKYPGGRAI